MVIIICDETKEQFVKRDLPRKVLMSVSERISSNDNNDKCDDEFKEMCELYRYLERVTKL